jgi:ABC-type glycerol-3-phosphate transport system substrate-binding protein
MLHKRWIPLIALGLLLAISTTACVQGTPVSPAEEAAPAQAPAEPVTVSYWHTMSDAEVEALEEVIAAFEAENPNINIEPTRYAYDDFKSALLTSIAGTEAPDTARLDIIWVPEFAELGALVALDEAMADFDAVTETAFPGPLSTNHWQGNYYGTTNASLKPASTAHRRHWTSSLQLPASSPMPTTISTASPWAAPTSGRLPPSSTPWEARS